LAQRIILRRDTAENWEKYDPVLAAGEVGLDLNRKSIKIGDGSRSWSELDWFISENAVSKDEFINTVGKFDDIKGLDVETIVEAINWILEWSQSHHHKIYDLEEEVQDLKNHGNEQHSYEFATVDYVDNISDDIQEFQGFFYSIRELERQYPEGKDGWTAIILEQKPLEDFDTEEIFSELDTEDWGYNSEDNKIEILTDDIEDGEELVVEYVVKDEEEVDYFIIPNRDYVYEDDNLTSSHKLDLVFDEVFKLMHSDFEGRSLFAYSEDHEKWLDI